MNAHSRSDTRPVALRAGIRDVESRIHRRRNDLSIAAGSIANMAGSLAHKVEEQIVSPGAIIAAGLFGAMLQRDQGKRGFGVLAILPLLSAGLRFLFKATVNDAQLSAPEQREYAAAENEFTAEGAPVQPQTTPGRTSMQPTTPA